MADYWALRRIILEELPYTSSFGLETTEEMTEKKMDNNLQTPIVVSQRIVTNNVFTSNIPHLRRIILDELECPDNRFLPEEEKEAIKIKVKDIEPPLRIGNARRKFKGKRKWKKKRKMGMSNNRTKLTGLASRSRWDLKCFLGSKRGRRNGRENVRERGKLGRECLGRERLGREGGGFGRKNRGRERRERSELGREHDRVTWLRLNAGMDGEEFDERGVRRRKARR